MPELEIKKTLKVQLPNTPNFIKIGDAYEHITKFTDEELRTIGAQWTLALVEKARKKRETPGFTLEEL